MAFNINDFTNQFMQWYGIGSQIGARHDLNQMREQTPQVAYAPPTATNNPMNPMGAPQQQGYEYLGQQFGEMPTQAQQRLLQQQERANIFESRGLFDDARMARQNLGTMEAQGLSKQIAGMEIEEKKRITDANKLLTKALDGDVDALSEVLKQGAKYVTDDNTPMTVNLSEDGKAATFRVGQGKGVTKSLAELSRGEISAIVNRVRPGVLASASPQYASLAQQDYQAGERFGLANQQFRTQTEQAEKRFKEQIRQFTTTDKRQKDNAEAQRKQWEKTNELSELRFDLADETFQHNREMDLAKLQNNKRLLDARIKEMQTKLRPAEWQFNWQVIQNPNSSPMEFAIAAGIKIDELSNPLVIQAIEAYQAEIARPGPLQRLPNQQIQGLPQQQQPQLPNVNPNFGLPQTIGVPG